MDPRMAGFTNLRSHGEPRYDAPNFPSADYYQQQPYYYPGSRGSFSAPYGFLPQPTFSAPSAPVRHVPQHVPQYTDMERVLASIERPVQYPQSAVESFEFLETLHNHNAAMDRGNFAQAAQPYDFDDTAFNMAIKQEPNYSWSTSFEEMAVVKPELEARSSSNVAVKRVSKAPLKPVSRPAPSPKPREDPDDVASKDLDGECREWACPVSDCGKTYRFKGDLKYHVKRKHPERLDLPSTISKPRSAKEGKTYPCPVATCSCGFKWARDLRRHVKTKHPENEEESSSSSSESLRGPAPTSTAAESGSFVTLSISSFYDDSGSMLSLPASLQVNDRN